MLIWSSYSWFIFMAYAEKCERGKGFGGNAQGNEQGLQGHANMLITQWYKDSPLSEFGILWMKPPPYLFCSGCRSVNAAPGQSPLCSTQRLKHICKWACSPNLNKPRCAEPEVKHIRMAPTWSLLGGSMQHRLGLESEQGGRDIETKSLCFSPAPGHAGPVCDSC